MQRLGKSASRLVRIRFCSSSSRRSLSQSARASTPTRVVADGFLSEGVFDGTSSVVVRASGTTRTMLVYEPNLSPSVIAAAAERLRILVCNDGVNSVLIASANTAKGSGGLPIGTIDPPVYTDFDDSDIVDPPGDVFNGYDHAAVHQAGWHKDRGTMKELMEAVAALSTGLSRNELSKVPAITLPHGMVNDGGYGFCMGSYVLATDRTAFRIVNPSRGLSFDPVGFSFFLPRLGWEYGQPSADFPGCGMILALTGFEADSSDMMETGLATNFVGSPLALKPLEYELSLLAPWCQQPLAKPKGRYFGQPPDPVDPSGRFRNVSAAQAVHYVTLYNATGTDSFRMREKDIPHGNDPSVDTDFIQWIDDRESDLVNFAATLDSVFQNANSVVAIEEGLAAVAGRDAKDSEEQQVVDVAQSLLDNMRRQSPLALHTIFRLMELGAKEGSTMEECIQREMTAQLNLFSSEDFDEWGRHNAGDGNSAAVPVSWKHDSLSDVSADEVAEILEL